MLLTRSNSNSVVPPAIISSLSSLSASLTLTLGQAWRVEYTLSAARHLSCLLPVHPLSRAAMSTSSAYKNVVGGKLKLKRPISAAAHTSAGSTKQQTMRSPASSSPTSKPASSASDQSSPSGDDRRESEQAQDDTREGDKRRKIETVTQLSAQPPHRDVCAPTR